MPRMAGIVAPCQPHQVVQGGNNREDVFFVEDDRGAYLQFPRALLALRLQRSQLLPARWREDRLARSQPPLPQAPMGDEIS